ncbi:hypothetical protein CA265_11250 [Sphingobacteriaceae bacterium GW460-11-11-14-LB5]|nr:hypothetical protein CA265_11250 [Sphingobacteriaceae bacterium GW460-11-11-14-LB5]
MKNILLIASFIIPSLSFAQSPKEKTLRCSYNFSNKAELKDWVTEGEGKGYIRDGKLILEPTYFPLLKKLMDEGKISKKNDAKEYQQVVENAMKQQYGDEISRYYATVNEKEGTAGNQPQFLGGSFNFWNKKFPTGKNFSIEFDFKALYPVPLHMVVFSTLGTNGKSIFDKTFPRRYGLSTEMMAGQMNNYRLSFFEPNRKTANLRKAPGRKLLYEGEDVISKNPDKTYHCEIKKTGGEISYIVDGKIVFTYTDHEPLGGGAWGFRLMPCAIAEYDNIKVYDLP